MGTVAINPPKTPVTQGSSGVAAATLPNVCKMPGPPAPFVPTPLPNIGKSGDSPKGYSKTVTIDGQPVAVAGASFGSQGDMASKGTGGGLISSNTHGPTKFLGPGSMNVQIEGKNVQLLSDPMLNNCGPSGSPANAATMTGLIQNAKVVAVTYGDDKPCGRCGKTHPLEAGAETLDMIRALTKAVRNAFDAQKEKIRDLNNANIELARKRRAHIPLRRLQKKGLLTDPQKQELAGLTGEIQSLEAKVGALEAFFEVNAVLRMEVAYGTFSKGYMLGVMICVCKQGGKLAACSGKAPPAFARAVSSAGFVCASPLVGGAGDNSDPWQCAAKQIMQKNQGHKPRQLIERWFSPMVKGLKTLDGSSVAKMGTKIVFEALVEDPVTKRVTLEKEYSKKDGFKSGENVPSCAKCQEGLPALYCDTKCP
ncbi:DUF4150 domain-containing protein [Myxococcus llanfairpwllgwyngyllgogerychwyrndrobwllllantysiliogogogochensis]|uniref:DUF4150 domain-containing protein n=1 Tax=Myxococcus llanfairpwllgwyngyllgogerychwyrndrobwllllantysiliogogogochensis TaxID=2590453 RepID=A0A540WXY1_9BACT|nr:DUF4150 domain-containing protein [Myxococcus llanfairpwllgwyngyllgogerychwyrndrobwllllantysiliogogogochensis]TQF13869.1 DUF4150 domain-containing protein [Myxococcus llanfairpwllgwyngyllgogerychwyrndrobwllllantysiliogogogochensis]